MKRVILDVDDVMAGFRVSAHRIIQERFGVVVTPEMDLTWDVTGVLERQEDRDEMNRIIEEPGFAASLPVLPGSVEAVRELRHRRVEVPFATSPNEKSETWMQERRLWLRRNYEATEDEIAQINRKHWLWADAMVDDKTTNVERWCKFHPTGIGLVWDQPYNRSASALARARSWRDVLDLFPM